jgi:hypothetical protein
MNGRKLNLDWGDDQRGAGGWQRADAGAPALAQTTLPLPPIGTTASRITTSAGETWGIERAPATASR